MKFCNFACQTFNWLGIIGHISTDSNRLHNDIVGNAIMPKLTLAQQAVPRHFGTSRQTICALWVWYNTIQSVTDRPVLVHTVTKTEIPGCIIWYRTTLATITAPQFPGLHSSGRHEFSLEDQYNIAECLQWCQQRVRWTCARWRTVWFSDECCFFQSRVEGMIFWDYWKMDGIV